MLQTLKSSETTLTSEDDIKTENKTDDFNVRINIFRENKNKNIFLGENEDVLDSKLKKIEMSSF